MESAATHVVLYDLFDSSHCQDEDERYQCGVATRRGHIGDLLRGAKRDRNQKNQEDFSDFEEFPRVGGGLL